MAASAPLEPGAPAAPAARTPLHVLAHALVVAAGAVIAALVALVNADVLSRALLDRPLRGVAEIVAIAMPVTVFLVLGWAGLTGGLIRAGALARRFDPRTHRFGLALEAVFASTGTLLSGIICAVTLPWLLRAWREGEFLGVPGDFTVPQWPAMLAVAAGSGLLAVVSAAAAATAGARLWRTYGVRGVLAVAMLLALPLPYLALTGHAAIGAFSVVLLFVLLGTGMPVAFALMSAAALGVAFIRDSAAIACNVLGLAASGAVSDYVFGAVPQFVLMGLVMARADIGRDALVAAQWLLRGILGGIGVATVAANALFAAMTGISIASAAIFSKVAVPPLIEHGFTPRFAVGLVAGSSVLGMLIPPSLLLIVYGLVAEVSINALFLAAIVPGLLLALLFAAMVVVVAWWRPAFALRAAPTAAPPGALGGRGAGRRLAPIALLAGAVLGGIYAGVFTPTEAGAIGSALAVAMALGMRRLGGRGLGRILFDCANTSASILLLIVAASAFGMMLTLSGIPAAVGQWAAAAGLDLEGYMLIYLVALVLLGMVLDSTSIVLIMVPLALPTVHALGGDPVWFGIVTVLGVEIGLLTPPLGLSVFAIKSSLDDQSISLNDIFLGALPFAALMAGLAVLLIAVPGLGRAFG